MQPLHNFTPQMETFSPYVESNPQMENIKINKLEYSTNIFPNPVNKHIYNSNNLTNIHIIITNTNIIYSINMTTNWFANFYIIEHKYEWSIDVGPVFLRELKQRLQQQSHLQLDKFIFKINGEIVNNEELIWANPGQRLEILVIPKHCMYTLLQ